MFEGATGAVGAAAALGNVGVGIYNAYQQHKMFEYQKDIQQEMFGREDTAIQRRVADLKAAGLSPVLAAGQGANAGPVVSTQAPRLDVDLQKGVLGVMEMLRGKADISKTEEEIKAIEAQKIKNEVETLNLIEQRKLIEQETRRTKADAVLKEHNNSVITPYPMESDPGMFNKLYRNFHNMMHDSFPGFFPRNEKEYQNKKKEVDRSGKSE